MAGVVDFMLQEQVRAKGVLISGFTGFLSFVLLYQDVLNVPMGGALLRHVSPLKRRDTLGFDYGY